MHRNASLIPLLCSLSVVKVFSLTHSQIKNAVFEEKLILQTCRQEKLKIFLAAAVLYSELLRCSLYSTSITRSKHYAQRMIESSPHINLSSLSARVTGSNKFKTASASLIYLIVGNRWGNNPKPVLGAGWSGHWLSPTCESKSDKFLGTAPWGAYHPPSSPSKIWPFRHFPPIFLSSFGKIFYNWISSP